MKGRPKLGSLNVTDMATRDSAKTYKPLWNQAQESEPQEVDIFFRRFISNDGLTRGDASAIITYTKVEPKLKELGVL